jgi:hypothetical protein
MKNDTAEYSASKAPETKKHAEERATVKDYRLLPGGALASPSEQGMAGLERESVPSEARDPEQTSYGDTGRPETK